jgi:serine protease Do
MKHHLAILTALGLFTGIMHAAEDRDAKVRGDLKTVTAGGLWVYNDLDKGIAEAAKTGKPLMVVFRCIPCVACATIDEQVVNKNPAVRDLMDQFVCVRIVQANRLDLTLFQYDYDQSFAVFFLNADKTIYGRFGTRSDQKLAERNISLESLREALAGALELHRGYPANKAVLAGKQPLPSKYKTPEDYPTLAGRYKPTLDYEGKVAQSCMHCHMVGEAQKAVYRVEGKAIPDEVLFAWPVPDTIGLALDPKAKARVTAVSKGSAAERDGFKAGDEIVTLQGQPMLSIGDVQWVLQTAKDPVKLQAEVRRNGKIITLPLTLEKGWRRQSDLSWRPTSWEMRRLGTGGIFMEDMTAEAREKAKAPAEGLALFVKHVGQYGAHALAKKEGFLKDDVIVAIEGRTDRLTETQFLTYLLQTKKPDSKVPVTVLRAGKRLEMQVPVPSAVVAKP